MSAIHNHLLEKLQEAKNNIEDSKLFYAVVSEILAYLNYLSVSDNDIFSQLEISKSTLDRWKRGLNAPHPLMYKCVYAYLEKKLNEYVSLDNID